MSEKTTPSANLPQPLREPVLAYLGSLFLGIDLAQKYVVTPLRRNAKRVTRAIESQGRIALRGRGTRRHAH